MQHLNPAHLRKASRMHTFVCVVLAICSWRGPIPVLHHHDQYSVDTRQQHLAVFHDASAESATNGDEWHWHIALPGSPDSSTECPSENVPADVCTLAFCVALDSGNQSVSIENALLSLMSFQPDGLQAFESDEHTATLALDQQLTTFADRLSYGDLSSITGVALI